VVIFCEFRSVVDGSTVQRLYKHEVQLIPEAGVGWGGGGEATWPDVRDCFSWESGR
jgi:hypothetical protein